MPQGNLIALKALLRQRHWTYATFCREYDKAAALVDKRFVGRSPSRAQYHRWLAGSTTRPHPDHCRVLEVIFPDWKIDALFGPWREKEDKAIEPPQKSDIMLPSARHGMGGVTSIFPTRSQFLAEIPPQELFDAATSIRTCGISLNLVCQQYPTNRLRSMIEDGGVVSCLFLNPNGQYILEREKEEGFDSRQLEYLTQINLDLLLAMRDSLSSVRNLRIGLYDEPARYNLTVIDDSLCVLQPYLPGLRGIESPTIVAARNVEDGSIFEAFNAALSSIEGRSVFL